MTIGLTWRRTARRIKRLKEGVLTISPAYSDRPKIARPPTFWCSPRNYSQRILPGACVLIQLDSPSHPRGMPVTSSRALTPETVAQPFHTHPQLQTFARQGKGEAIRYAKGYPLPRGPFFFASSRAWSMRSPCTTS